MGNTFHLKDVNTKDLFSGVGCKFQSGLYNKSYYGECVRHLNIRIGDEHGMLQLTTQYVKLNNSSVDNHLLLLNYSASYDGFSVLNRENKKFLLDLKVRLLIMRSFVFE